MLERISLRELLNRNPEREIACNEQHPLAVFSAEQPWLCRAVLDKTAILVSITDDHDRHPVKLENVFVDPATVQWAVVREQSAHDGAKPLAHGKRWPSQRTLGVRIAPDQRAKSDRRARETQAAVGAISVAELGRSAADATPDAAPVDRILGVQVTGGTVSGPAAYDDVHPVSVAEAVGETVAVRTESPTPSKAFDPVTRPFLDMTTLHEPAPAIGRPGYVEPLKFCRGCGKEKPKSEFREGKGYFKCQTCLDASVVAPGRSSAVDRNRELAERGMKHCPRCDRDLNLDAFNRNASKGDGLQSICRKCLSDTWTRGSTASRHQNASLPEPAADSPEAITPLETYEGFEVVARGARPIRPSLTFTDLLDDLRKFKEHVTGLEAEVLRLTAENDAFRLEQSGLYEALQAIVDDIPQSALTLPDGTPRLRRPHHTRRTQRASSRPS